MKTTTSRKTTARHSDARTAYADTRRTVLEALARIEAGLAQHGEKWLESNRSDWGYVGDLTTMAAKLEEVADWICP